MARAADQQDGRAWGHAELNCTALLPHPFLAFSILATTWRLGRPRLGHDQMRVCEHEAIRASHKPVHVGCGPYMQMHAEPLGAMHFPGGEG